MPDFCIHNVLSKTCIACVENFLCEHSFHRLKCTKCNNISPCPHGHINFKCDICNGNIMCGHKKEKYKCCYCKGVGMCQHGLRKARCRVCHGSQICSHDKQKSNCKICSPHLFCTHGSSKYKCRLCRNIFMDAQNPLKKKIKITFKVQSKSPSTVNAKIDLKTWESIGKHFFQNENQDTVCVHQKKRIMCRECNPPQKIPIKTRKNVQFFYVAKIFDDEPLKRAKSTEQCEEQVVVQQTIEKCDLEDLGNFDDLSAEDLDKFFGKTNIT